MLYDIIVIKSHSKFDSKFADTYHGLCQGRKTHRKSSISEGRSGREEPRGEGKIDRFYSDLVNLSI